MNFQVFGRMYASRFRALGPEDGLAEWVRDIEKPEVEDETMRDALVALDANHRALSRGGERFLATPRIGEVMAAYRVAAEEARKAAYKMPDYKCRMCDGTGWGWGVKTDRGYWIVPRHPEARPRESFYVVLIPCACPSGRDEYPAELRHRLGRYIVGPCNDAMQPVRELRDECSRLTREAEHAMADEADRGAAA